MMGPSDPSCLCFCAKMRRFQGRQAHNPPKKKRAAQGPPAETCDWIRLQGAVAASIMARADSIRSQLADLGFENSRIGTVRAATPAEERVVLA